MSTLRGSDNSKCIIQKMLAACIQKGLIKWCVEVFARREWYMEVYPLGNTCCRVESGYEWSLPGRRREDVGYIERVPKPGTTHQ